jgi:ankyrin repeat protein
MEGVSPVFMAINNGHMAVARCLVNECGADINQATLDGFTPQLRSLIESSRIGNNVG